MFLQWDKQGQIGVVVSVGDKTRGPEYDIAYHIGHRLQNDKNGAILYIRHRSFDV
jgi:predicted site-specific integrase-resolvase